jgi:hypothetical protein
MAICQDRSQEAAHLRARVVLPQAVHLVPGQIPYSYAPLYDTVSIVTGAVSSDVLVKGASSSKKRISPLRRPSQCLDGGSMRGVHQTCLQTREFRYLTKEG